MATVPDACSFFGSFAGVSAQPSLGCFREKLINSYEDLLQKLTPEELMSFVFLTFNDLQLAQFGHNYCCYIRDGKYGDAIQGIKRHLCIRENANASDATLKALYLIGRLDLLEDDLGVCIKHKLSQIKLLSCLDERCVALFSVFSSLTQTEADELLKYHLSSWYYPSTGWPFEMVFCCNLTPTNFNVLMSEIFYALIKAGRDSIAEKLGCFIKTEHKSSSARDDVYPTLRSYPYGLCVIINIKEYIEPRRGQEMIPLDTRRGSDIDVQQLIGTFKLFGFEIVQLKNPTYEKICMAFKNLRMLPKISIYSCLVVCVMTHGDENDNIYLHDRTCIPLTNLRQLCFSQFLVDKPRLYFVQACRGEQALTPVFLQRDSTSSVVTSPINSESDCIICAATVRGYQALRSQSSGSWFITDLCSSLQEIGHLEPLKRVLQLTRAKLKARVEMMDGHYVTQMSEDKDTLLKDVQFQRTEEARFLEGIIDLASLEAEEDLIDLLVYEIIDSECQEGTRLYKMLQTYF